ncbi:unnamed protein product [Moneuplotes crassus]|uniref:Uncharacterized protein n=1 Tax=Euplotes crassus TaxID=5936 RepID=A0AAD1UI26_EUPCR|nr:unnamed protein product [Moneuplotes crassus]
MTNLDKHISASFSPHPNLQSSFCQDGAQFCSNSDQPKGYLKEGFFPKDSLGSKHTEIRTNLLNQQEGLSESQVKEEQISVKTEELSISLNCKQEIPNPAIAKYSCNIGGIHEDDEEACESRKNTNSFISNIPKNKDNQIYCEECSLPKRAGLEKEYDKFFDLRHQHQDGQNQQTNTLKNINMKNISPSFKKMKISHKWNAKRKKLSDFLNNIHPSALNILGYAFPLRSYSYITGKCQYTNSGHSNSDYEPHEYFRSNKMDQNIWNGKLPQYYHCDFILKKENQHRLNIQQYEDPEFKDISKSDFNKEDEQDVKNEVKTEVKSEPDCQIEPQGITEVTKLITEDSTNTLNQVSFNLSRETNVMMPYIQKKYIEDCSTIDSPDNYQLKILPYSHERNFRLNLGRDSEPSDDNCACNETNSSYSHKNSPLPSILKPLTSSGSYTTNKRVSFGPTLVMKYQNYY